MRQKFDQEFREQAVQMALEKKISQKQLAEDLGIGKSTLTSWIRTYKNTSGSFPSDRGYYHELISNVKHVSQLIGIRINHTDSIRSTITHKDFLIIGREYIPVKQLSYSNCRTVFTNLSLKLKLKRQNLSSKMNSQILSNVREIAI